MMVWMHIFGHYQIKYWVFFIHIRSFFLSFISFYFSCTLNTLQFKVAHIGWFNDYVLRRVISIIWRRLAQGQPCGGRRVAALGPAAHRVHRGRRDLLGDAQRARGDQAERHVGRARGRLAHPHARALPQGPARALAAARRRGGQRRTSAHRSGRWRRHPECLTAVPCLHVSLVPNPTHSVLSTYNQSLILYYIDCCIICDIQ